MYFTFLSASSGGDAQRVQRVLDTYANRIGPTTWSTVCREEALSTIRASLLAASGGRTAVACLEVVGFKRKTERVRWIVGRPSWVVDDGRLRYILRERSLPSAGETCARPGLTGLLPALALASEASSLDHDLGKNTRQFQQKLARAMASVSSPRVRDPLRHELVSLIVRQALRDDPSLTLPEALERGMSKASSDVMLAPPSGGYDIPWLVDWAVAAHHKLPDSGFGLGAYRHDPLAGLTLEGFDGDAAKHTLAVSGAERALQDIRTLQDDSLRHLASKSRLAEEEAEHLARGNSLEPCVRAAGLLLRTSLVLSDHYVSSLGDASTAARKSAFATVLGMSLARHPAQAAKALANPTQSLEGHLQTVARGSVRYLKSIVGPGQLSRWLPRLGVGRLATAAGREGRFAWQGLALDMLQQRETALGLAAVPGPIFVAVTSSTGSGKTRACAAIANLLGRGRFVTALNLRTLTLQTGDEYRSKLGLYRDEVSVLIGSSAHMRLHELRRDEPGGAVEESYNMDGSVGARRLPDFLACHLKGPNSETYLAAPVLVTTVDNIISAGDLRKKRWIAPLLRLADGCLVLDEVDQYDLLDLPALCRMVFVLGLLGQPLVCSTATLYPDIAFTLYRAYAAGASEHRAVQAAPGLPPLLPDYALISDVDGALELRSGASVSAFEEDYVRFAKRIDASFGAQTPRLCEQLELRPIDSDHPPTNVGPMDEAYGRIVAHCSVMHALHSTSHSGVRLSVGLVRFARVNDVLGFAGCLGRNAGSGASPTRFKVIPYHSKLPLAMRSALEARLDRMLMRGSDPNAPLQLPEVREAMESCERDGIADLCIVLAASPVEEVGRDHDLDWAIIEPSSSRSIVQCAGRVQRHRRQVPSEPNVAVLSEPMRAVENAKGAIYARPGFESAASPFPRGPLASSAPWISGGFIHSGPCLNPDPDLYGSFSQLESKSIKSYLDAFALRAFIDDRGSFFTGAHADEHGFRVGPPNLEFFIDPWSGGGGTYDVYQIDASDKPSLRSDAFKFETVVPVDALLLPMSLAEVADDLADSLGMDVTEASRRMEFAKRFFCFQVRESSGRVKMDVRCGYVESSRSG